MEQFLKILPVLLKGISAAQILAQTDPGPAYRAMAALLRKASAGPVTDKDLEVTETDLDKLMDRFNRPI